MADPKSLAEVSSGMDLQARAVSGELMHEKCSAEIGKSITLLSATSGFIKSTLTSASSGLDHLNVTLQAISLEIKASNLEAEIRLLKATKALEEAWSKYTPEEQAAIKKLMNSSIFD